MRLTHTAAVGKRERTKAANREAILVAARRVFSDIGYGAASVRDVVRETDLATGTFYNYFPDKESVLRALVDEITVEARARVRTARMGATTLEGFVSGGFRAFSSSWPRIRHGRAHAPLRDHPRDVRRARSGRGHRRVPRRPRDGQSRSWNSRRDADLVAVAMVGAGVEIGLHMVERDPPDVERAVAFVTDVFLGAFERIG